MKIHEIKEKYGDFIFEEVPFEEIYKSAVEFEKDWLDFLEEGIKPWDKQCQEKNRE